MVNTLVSAQGASPDPVVASQLHVLAFPFQDHIIGAGSGSCLDDLLLARSGVLEFGVRAEAMEDRFVVLLLFELVCGHNNAVEGIVAEWDGRMCAWRRFNRPSFLHLLAFFLVLVDPKLMGGLVHLQVRDFFMRIV